MMMPEVDAFPVRYSLLAPEALRATVGAEYDVGTPLRCILWLNGVTETYAVTTERDRYILRLYRAGWRTDEDIAYELDAIRHLAHKGVPVSVPVARMDGTWFRSVQAPEGPRQMVLFTHAGGREAYLEEGYAVRYGRSVAEIHSATDDFHSARLRFHLDFNILLDRPLAHIQPLLAHRPADWQYLLNLAARMRQRIEALASAGLEWGFCHGDTLGSNAFLDGETIIHFDFDDCGFGWRAYDLATYLWICTWTAAETGAPWWDAFLQGYRERRPIGELDLAAVLFFVALREFWVMGQQTRGASIRGHYWVADDYFDDRLRFLREWEQQFDKN